MWDDAWDPLCASKWKQMFATELSTLAEKAMLMRLSSRRSWPQARRRHGGLRLSGRKLTRAAAKENQGVPWCGVGQMGKNVSGVYGRMWSICRVFQQPLGSVTLVNVPSHHSNGLCPQYLKLLLSTGEFMAIQKEAGLGPGLRTL